MYVMYVCMFSIYKIMISSFNSHFISLPNKHDEIINNVIIDPDSRNYSVKIIYALNDQV